MRSPPPEPDLRRPAAPEPQEAVKEPAPGRSSGQSPVRSRARKEEARPARTFTDFVHVRRTGRDRFRPQGDKLWARRIAEACGVAVPALHGLYPSPDAVSFAELPERFALKPTSLTNQRGVFLLERRGERYFDRITRETLPAAEVATRLEALFEAFPRRPATLIAEELIETETPIPIDYKFFVFGTEILLVEHINRNGGRRVLFYDEDFRVMNLRDRIKLNFARVRLDRPRPPACRAAMVEAVRTVAARLATPFARIDMYAGRAGPILGEITPTPGGAYFGSGYRLTPAYDAELGRRWARAAEALGQPIPRITGMAPIQQMVATTVPVGKLELRDMKSELRALRIERDRLTARLDRLEQSLSWRITLPFRGLWRRLAALGRASGALRRRRGRGR
jgi:hypothetical protein